MKEFLRNTMYGIYNGSIGLFDIPFYVPNKRDAKDFYEQALIDIRHEIQIMSKEAHNARDSILQDLRP